MNKLSKFMILTSFASLANFAQAEEHSKLPIFVRYTHNGDIDAHLNLSCEVGKVSSFSAPFLASETPYNDPKWQIKVKPLSLVDGDVEIEATILERGKVLATPRVKTKLGEPVTLTLADSSGETMTLELKTQQSEGLDPVKTFKYKPQHISISDAIACTSFITDEMEKFDLRTSVSYDDAIEYVGTEDLLKKIRQRLAQVDVNLNATAN